MVICFYPTSICNQTGGLGPCSCGFDFTCRLLLGKKKREGGGDPVPPSVCIKIGQSETFENCGYEVADTGFVVGVGLGVEAVGDD